MKATQAPVVLGKHRTFRSTNELDTFIKNKRRRLDISASEVIRIALTEYFQNPENT